MTKENHGVLTRLFDSVFLTLPPYPMTEYEAEDAETEFEDGVKGIWFRPGPLADVIIGDPEGCLVALNSLSSVAGLDRWEEEDFDLSAWPVQAELEAQPMD